MGREGEEEGQFRLDSNPHGQHSARGETTVGGPCQKVEVQEVDLCAVNDPKDLGEWEKEMGKAGIGED